MTRAIFPIAWRNLTRNLRRTLITAGSIAIGVGALLFLWGFNDGLHNGMMRNIATSFAGGIQIHKAGFFQHPKMEEHLTDLTAIQKLLDAHPKLSATRRLMTFALAAGKDTSAGTMLMGVDPAGERLATRIPEKVTRGRFFTSNTEKSCIMGGTQARNLKVGIGDEVVLLSQDRFGGMAADRFTLVGIIDSGEMGIDRGLVLIPLGAAQALLGMEGKVTTVLLQPPMDQLEQVTADFKKGLAGQDVEVLRWYDMYPMMKEWVSIENGFYYIFLGIVLFLVVAGVLNTVLVSMLERVREFGILMALGTQRLEIAAIVLIESLLTVTTGIVLGTVLGLGLVAHFHTAGIDLGAALDAMVRYYIDPVVHTEIDTNHLLATVISMSIATLIASLWPAWKATRLEPVEAIHHV